MQDRLVLFRNDLMIDIDDMIMDQEEHERCRTVKSPTTSSNVLDDMLMGEEPKPQVEEEGSAVEAKEEQNRMLIGTVEKFFGKINVAAIELVGDLKVGDTIEIESDGKNMRMKVSGMQINKKDVTAAAEGDSIGIKVARPVSSGNSVYILGK
jgi:hypothetical protein